MANEWYGGGGASNQYLINKAYVEGVRNIQNLATRSVVNQAAAQAVGEAALVLELYAEVLKSQYKNRKKRMTNINKEVGLDAQHYTLETYKERVNPHNTPAYRENASGSDRRYAGGKMIRAISDPGFFRASSDGILFGNSSVMDRHAKQWYRLNFGAGPKGKTGPYKAGEYRLRFFGEASGAPVTLRGYNPSEAFYVPRGLFVDGGGIPQKLGARRGDIFVPLRGKKLPDKLQKAARGKLWGGGMSAGFGGYHFMDAGMKRIAVTWPIGLTRMIQEWVNEAGAVDTGPVAKLNVPKGELAALSKTLNAEMARLGTNRRARGFIRTVGGFKA